MENLTQADGQQLLETLRSLYEPCSLEEFPARSLSILSKLVGAELFGYTSFSLQEASIPRHYTFPTVEAGIVAESFTTQRQQFLAHPVLANYIKSGDRQALAISDFLSEQEFYRKKALYEGVFQRFGLADQMLIYFEVPSISATHPLYQGQDVLGLSLSRDRRSFTERDRLILNLIRPHVKQAHQNVAAFTKVQQQFTQLSRATEQVGLIALSIDGKAQWMTQQAEKLLHQYFPQPKIPIALPDLLQRWVNQQISTLTQSTEIPSPQLPLYLEQDKKQLRVRFHYHLAIGQIHLLLEETQPDRFSLKSLELLGLTKREAEVLFWVAKDQTTQDIAKRLGMSDRTVKKHLEHIYEKFGVQTRLAAVMYALHQLGIFSP